MEGVGATHPHACQHAEEGGAEGGQVAEQAFGIAGGFVQHAWGEDVAVDEGYEVLILVEEGDVADGEAGAGDGDPAHQDPVGDQGDYDDGEFGLPAAVPEVEEAGDEVADRDALQDAVDAPARWVDVREGLEEAAEIVNDDAEGEEGGGAADGLPGELGAGDAAGKAGFEGEDDRGSDDKEESGEDEVGGGEAVPVGVLHEPPGVVGAIVVDHDHEGDGEAAEDVEGDEAADGAGSGGEGGAGDGAGAGGLRG